MSQILKVNNISKTFDKPVLRDISFEIEDVKREGYTQGQIVSLVGRSGSGKSTLFNILAGLLTPDSGEVKAHFGAVREGDMGVVFQNSWVYPWRKVNWILKQAALKGYKDEDRAQGAYEEIARHFSLEDHLNKYSSQLSGGQRQRVAIAEQVLNNKDFILLDEPFSGLDTLAIDKVTRLLVDVSLTSEEKTIIIISHDLSNSLAISDTVLILAKEEGKEGATITEEICLVDMGLAWQPDIKNNPKFRELIDQVKTLL